MAELTNKEKYLLETFKIDEELIKKISEIGRLVGTHKYDIWIAKEVKKDNTLLNNLEGFLFVIDWAQKERPNISSLSFEQASVQSQEWHDAMKFDETAKNKEKEDDNKILYRCHDGIHFFVLLDPEDLRIEGETMRNCVGSYVDKVKGGRSLIVSLRDDKNESHVTIEIDTNTGMAIQTKGKGNGEPAAKYLKLITEFAIFASGYSNSMDRELLELMNMKFD
ncbi:MAG TPA: PcfJ domain-containing protein [Nitrosopumilaceae archaeon]|jgi:hypothetical protein|nr:PcfJ domain-containing protein [Nitrosopumilaceae archaeon]